MNNDLLIWVDEDDNPTGCGEKIATHQKCQLHRAFSVFIMSQDNKLLLQRRAQGKYHSGGFLSNSCCSHPLTGDCDWLVPIRRCIKNELGADAAIISLKYAPDPVPEYDTAIYHTGKFHYTKHYTDLSENELDHVFLYMTGADFINKLNPNPDEISELCWVDIDTFDMRIVQSPQDFTAWFSQAYELVKNFLSKSAER